MSFEKFLEQGRRIVADHRAQYKGTYYMKGGFLGKILNNPITQIVSDIAAVATGNPELIPFINAGERAAGGLVKGESVGKALGQGALAGGEAFAGQEILGAAANQFPETFGALGVTDTGGNALTDILGTTQGAGSLTGAGTLGGDIKSLFSGGGASSATSPGAAITSSGGGNAGGTAISAPSGGGIPSGASAIAPPSASSGSSVLDSLNDPTSSLSSAATAAGGANVGTQSLGITPADSNFLSNAQTAANTTNATGSLISSPTTPSFAQKALSAVSSPSALLAGGGLALDAVKGNQAATGEKALKAEASQLAGQGQKLGSYLESGTLPAGLQQSLNQATNAAKATIRSKYASMGLSGSSSEQQELQSVDERAQAQGAQQAMQLLQTGISETGMASQLYQALMGESMQNDKDLSSAIASFASAAGGGSGSGGVTINTGGR